MSKPNSLQVQVSSLIPNSSASEPAASPEQQAASGSEVLPEEQIVAGNTSHTRPENRAFYPALDGLRAIAFLMVFFTHYCAMPWGWAGVDLFFVLSGFLITGILFDTREDRHRVRNFYVRRTLRIFPLYYGVMLLILPFTYQGLSWSWLAWPAYLGNYARMIGPYTVGSPLQRLADFQPVVHMTIHRAHPAHLALGHFWSLCIEEQFYLLWPWIVFRIRERRTLLSICASSIPICVAARLLGQHLLPSWMLHNEVLYRVTPFRLDALLLGGFLALWIRGPHRDLLLRAARVVWPVALVPVVMAVMWRHFWRDPYPEWRFTWGLLVIDLVSALAVACAIQPGSVLYLALNWRPFRWLGRMSYGAYVLHDIPRDLYIGVAHWLVPSYVPQAAALLAFLSTCVLSWLSYRFFESPFLNLKERWTIRSVA
ncbi:MAG TPA: acyltransferase [Acidobacteriaceae bacterium]